MKTSVVTEHLRAAFQDVALDNTPCLIRNSSKFQSFQQWATQSTRKHSASPFARLVRLSNILKKIKKFCLAPSVRKVPAFTIQALQRNTEVVPPSRQNLYTYQKPPPSTFRRLYIGMDLPISIDTVGGNSTLRWKVVHFNLNFFF